MNREQALAAYVEEVSLDRDFWRRSNCMLFVGRWVAIVRPSFDVSRWIDAHGSLAEASADVKRAGGMAALFASEAARAGLDEIDPAAAELGDVGFFEIPEAAMRLGSSVSGETLFPSAIRSALHWMVRGGDGVGRIAANGPRARRQPVRAWRV